MFSFKDKNINSIDEIIGDLPKVSTINVIVLSNNKIKDARLDLLPTYIKSVILDNNLIESITWDTRNWGLIKLDNNQIDFQEINNLKCRKFDISKNKMEEDLQFVNCEIGELIVSNNKINVVKFKNCSIQKLDISNNNILVINQLPKDIKELNASNNQIIQVCYLPDTLFVVELSNNKLAMIENIPRNINKLDLSNNLLLVFDFLFLPTNLDYLDLSNNQIPNIKQQLEKCKIEQLFLDENTTVESSENKVKVIQTILKDLEPESINSDDDDISLVYKSKEERCSKTESNSTSEDEEADDDSSTSSTAVKISKNPRVYKINEDSDGEFVTMPSGLEEEFQRLNTDAKQKSKSKSDSDSDSDSDDDIGDVIAKFRSGIKATQNRLDSDDIIEKVENMREELKKDQTLEKLTIINIEEKKEEQNPQIVQQELSEDQKIIIEILKSRAQRKNKNNNSVKTFVDIKWSFVI